MPLVKLFASVLRKQPDGTYWLVTPVERGQIEVEDVPFVIVELIAEGSGDTQEIKLRSNLDDWVTVGPDHPLRLRQSQGADPAAPPIPYVDIRANLEGRLLRSVYYELMELCEPNHQEGVTRYGVWSQGQFFALDEQPL